MTDQLNAERLADALEECQVVPHIAHNQDAACGGRLERGVGRCGGET